MKYNLIVKVVEGKEYLISDFIATTLNKSQAMKIVENNKKIFNGCYRFIEFKDTDFNWWQKVDKYLTKNKLYKNTYFDIDFNGNITRC